MTKSLNRRGFLKGAGAAMLTGNARGEPSSARRPAALPPTEAQLEAETQAVTRSPKVADYIVENPASDYLVDVLRALEIEYCAANCGSSFEGLQESIITLRRQPNAGVSHLSPRGIVGPDGARLRQDRGQADDDMARCKGVRVSGNPRA